MESLASQLNRPGQLTGWALMKMVIRLSIPAILAEISSIVMQYIDAAMVGTLGENASASIGLVVASTWLMNGLCVSMALGFSVQVAHLIGAERPAEARNVTRQGLLFALLLGLFLGALGVSLSHPLPRWLGGEEAVVQDASIYFFYYSLGLPFAQLRQMAGAILQCSGDMKTPSFLNILLCVFDVIFNAVLIFPTREIPGTALLLPGAGMGVAGAGLGTALSEVVTGLLMTSLLCFRSRTLRLSLGGRWTLQQTCLKKALRISIPAAMEHSILNLAYIVSTGIVAPLGTTAVAAHSLANTAESFCYMPGYGIGAAATTLVGQSLGAGRRDVARRVAWLCVLLGLVVMGSAGLCMFFLAPVMMSMLTPVAAVRTLGVRVLRIEAFAEPLYSVSITAAGAMRGAGDTLVPSILVLVSMWGIRITSSLILAGTLGLVGVWIAMCAELCLRGILFAIRLKREKWLKNSLLSES